MVFDFFLVGRGIFLMYTLKKLGVFSRSEFKEFTETE